VLADLIAARKRRPSLGVVTRRRPGADQGGRALCVILAWLWRRLYGPDPGRTPRRLIYALPQRSLTDQV
jgi:CRISPR-associated endonuclease/helicase Cas3